MTTVWMITNAILAFVMGSVGSSVGQAVYEAVKAMADYVWLKPEEGYFLDYPEDKDQENNLENVISRLKKISEDDRRNKNNR
jgi:hypothetical protein